MSPALHQKREHRRRSSTRLLRRSLAETSACYREGGAPTLRHLIAPLGSEAAALAAALLSLPFLSPVSLGPITTPVSVLIALLGWQLLHQRSGAPLPQRLLDVALPRAAHGAMVRAVRLVHRTVRRVSRPRLLHLVDARRGRTICAVGIVSAAVLLAVPIPLLPLTNTFPALGVLLFALGWLEQDGLLTLLAVAALACSLAVFTAVGAAVAVLGWEVVQGTLPALDWR